jgi:heat-inducible transcriptional repressor
MPAPPATRAPLSDRQRLVLRAVVTTYVGERGPVGSQTLSYLLPIPLSSASIRNTLAELTGLGLVEKPHTSAGRVPTEPGLRLFVDELLDPRDLGDYEKRELADRLGAAVQPELLRAASRLLSERTRQLGFVVAPRLERLPLSHVSLVRLAGRRLLVVLVAESGAVTQRVVEDDGAAAPELERMARLLNDRVAGQTLGEVRERLAREARRLREKADRILARALAVGARALERSVDAGDLVVASWLALLDQPEFRDLERIRGLLAAVETQERLLAVLDEILPTAGVRVAFGEEVGEPVLRECALVAAPYGEPGALAGVLGVIGPRRMDYARVIPLVGYLSTLVTERLGE